MNNKPRLNRRRFLTSVAIIPMAMPSAGLATPLQDQERCRVLALIAQLENPPGYQARSQHWVKAHVAGQLREALGMEIPPHESRCAYARYEAKAHARHEHLSTSL